MIIEQKLYSDVPPTKLRNQDEKFRPAETSPFWLWLANTFFYGMLENRFFALRYKGAEKFANRDENVPTICFAPHANWWDGIVFYNMAMRVFHKEIRIMVEELNRFPILRHAGAFPVNKKSPQASMTALKYAVDAIGNLDSVLCIFPQGIIKPPNFRPFEFQTGLTYIAQKTVEKYGKVNLVPFAINYCFLRADRPEVLVEIADPIVLDDATVDRKGYTHYLEKIMTEVCDNQFSQICHGELDDYKTLFQQKLKWYRKLEQHLKKIEIKGSGV